MKALLDGLLPRLFPGWIAGRHFLCVPHEGKSDLDRSIPRKLAAWRIPGDRFVILRDSDGADCIEVKHRLLAMCERADRAQTLVRLACQERESWYLGDLEALAAAFGAPKVNTTALRKRWSRPDEIRKPSTQVKRLVPAFQKVGGARLMAQHLDLGTQRNKSRSFQAFIAGVQRVSAELGREDIEI